jgi:hypothetical protein
MKMKEIDIKKIETIDKIIKRLDEDFIITKEFDLLKLIDDYGLNFILHDLTKLIKEIKGIK